MISVSYLNRLNETYNSLISGKIDKPESALLKETEELFFKNHEVYVKKYLGLLYFFSNDYFLSYSLLKNETDELSKFFFMFSLVRLRYIKEAKKYMELFNNIKILKNVSISIAYRAELAFLLGLDKTKLTGETDDLFVNALIHLTDNFNIYCNENKFIDAIYSGNNRLIINEYKRTMKNAEPTNYEIIKHDYSDDFLSVHSNSTKIGNNMYLLTINGSNFIVDCGADTKDSAINFDEFFTRYNLTKNNIEAVFFTHSHLDHIGNALNLLSFLDYSVPFYLTVDTQNLAGDGNQIYIDGRKLRYITYNTGVSFGNDIQATFVKNGHILGSSCIVFKSCGKTVLFTSDFCLHDQSTVKGMSLSQVGSYIGSKLNYLITESTYGHNDTALNYEDNLILFNLICEKLFKYNTKVFLPAYAIGRAQEILNAISENESIPKPIINVLGRANNVSLYYQNLEKCKSIKIYNDRDNPLNYDFIIASSGRLIEDSESYILVNDLLKNKINNVAIIQTGYLPPNEEGASLIREWCNSGNLYFEASLSAHASLDELHKVIDYFEPKKIISIHGDGIL